MSTRIRDSPYKQKLSSLEQGAKVRVSRPQGNFVLHEDYSKPAVFLSGGIGVTPFRSMVKYATDKQLPLRITMFDSNRSAQNIFYTVTEDPGAGWSGERSRIDRTMLETKLSKDEISNAVFYICGPPGMLNAMQELLRNELRTPDERIRVEEFTGY
jgi:ferredoxin-NADP reductase